MLNECSSIEARLELTDQLNNISEQIKNIKSKKKEYFLDNSKFIFDYFESKKDISNGTKISEPTSKSKLVNSFFKIKETHKLDADNYVESNNIVRKYLSNIDDTFIDMGSYICQTDICQICQIGELIPLEDEGVMVCNSCARSIPYLIENEKPSYKEPPKEACSYAYKRINHFKEILSRFLLSKDSPMPFTATNSSTDLKGPKLLR